MPARNNGMRIKGSREDLDDSWRFEGAVRKQHMVCSQTSVEIGGRRHAEWQESGHQKVKLK